MGDDEGPKVPAAQAHQNPQNPQNCPVGQNPQNIPPNQDLQNPPPVMVQNKDVVVVVIIISDPNAKYPMLLLLENSDSPSRVEQ